ncbi:MAG: 4,5-dihydroxyphthalate decarboxylase [Rhodospirillaceae bacterium]|nr:4,5-dihydroxyphthalate decarboxylase [Rhodospirillaceae bacterium]
MAKLPVTMACGPYDRMEALSSGIIQPEGIDLRYIAIQSPPEIFARMIKTRSFDVAEMSLAHYLISKIRGDFPYIAIPVFPSRVFRHGFVFINKNAGIESARDLENKRVGVQEYRQTAGVWVRGILQDEFDVDMNSIDWFEGGVNAPRAEDNEMDLRPTRDLPLTIIAGDKSLNQMLEAGEIDAYFGARRPDALHEGKNTDRLFPNYRELEKAYYKKTGIHPIMHTLVIREELFRDQPWMAESLFKAAEKSKEWAIEQMRFSGAQRLMLPWLHDEIEEMEQLMGSNAWAYGVEANRGTLETFMKYLVDQHFLEKTEPIDDYFTPIISWSE